MRPEQEDPAGSPPALDRGAMEAAQERDAAVSLERLEAGGVPVQAERRLGELARGERTTFTSDLSVNGWALCHQLGLRPLTQVMGSSIYQVGYSVQTSGPGSFLMGPGSVQMGGELSVLTEAWNKARALALGRLVLEARQAGADAVVGVKVQHGTRDWAEGAIEYVITGTAVADPARDDGGEPVLTDLSVADYAKLRSVGIDPLGLVAWTSVHVAWYPTMGVAMEPERFQSYERREFTQAVYGAREQTMERVQQQAEGLGASGIVGMRVGHAVRELGEREEGGITGRRWHGAMLTFDAMGTAVHDAGAGPGAPPKMTLNLST